MRIALVAPFGLRAKGTTRARVVPLGRALAAHGHEVTVFVPPYDSPEDSGRTWAEGGITIRHVRVPSPVVPEPLSHLLLSWLLWRSVARYMPDVLHVFKPKGPSGLAAAAAWTVRRPPAALVVDSDDWEGPGGWNDDPRTGYSPLQRRFFTWQERYGLSHAHAWTVVSACLRARAVAHGASSDRVYLLPNAVDQRFLESACLEGEPVAGPAAPTVLLYTRFAGVRVTDVSDVWRRVRAFMPQARLMLVGRGLAEEQDQLAREVESVEVCGWIEPIELPVLLSRAAVAIAPWADTASNRARHSAKILELMAAGLPVVAYQVGELAETIGDSGTVVPPGDADGMAQAVVGLLRDPDRARRLGEAARARVLARYTWERQAHVALEAYRVARQKLADGYG
jgi:glycosyltransferase involved in cell wall biosynthesis